MKILNSNKMSKQKSWREIAAPIIREVLERTRGLPESERKLEFTKAFPFKYIYNAEFGEIWENEIKIQTGKKKRGKPGRQKDEQSIDPKQKSLF